MTHFFYALDKKDKVFIGILASYSLSLFIVTHLGKIYLILITNRNFKKFLKNRKLKGGLKIKKFLRRISNFLKLLRKLFLLFYLLKKAKILDIHYFSPQIYETIGLFFFNVIIFFFSPLFSLLTFFFNKNLLVFVKFLPFFGSSIFSKYKNFFFTISIDFIDFFLSFFINFLAIWNFFLNCILFILYSISLSCFYGISLKEYYSNIKLLDKNLFSKKSFGNLNIAFYKTISEHLLREKLAFLLCQTFFQKTLFILNYGLKLTIWSLYVKLTIQPVKGFIS